MVYYVLIEQIYDLQLMTCILFLPFNLEKQLQVLWGFDYGWWYTVQACDENWWELRHLCGTRRLSCAPQNLCPAE